ncbi:DUF7130 family rubredoxin-like protein [Candidatus Halobonum tyrrellensis]|uniref:DUF7130 domain-containing protein n=1 Tax=Candidatus Halobonum tyrrellensis G22 TaxID=1324957 RepID=V4J3J2_9EURY|nr:hypothetical protein [Candidatus Halobonum tyrrellensis]ESP89957.1 hypothetical protein K933_00302 [Candidatus Halobonum tyrrellensis G22]
MSDSPDASDDPIPIETGSVVYDHEGNRLGVIDGLTSEGFEVDTNAEIESVDDEGHAEVSVPDDESAQAAETNDENLYGSEQEHDPGQEFGEGYIMWRCENCGEMGELEDGLPEECPDCGSEEVIKWRED